MYEDYRVLFVDDEPNILSSLRRGLAEEEYLCHFASSGQEALRILKEEKIAVIVTDMRMPEMNGLELLLEVSSVSPETVKIVLSGYTQLPQILATINQVDIYKFITKPWVLEDVIIMLQKALDYYIMLEEHQNHKKVLEAKNLSYKNILNKINIIIADAKKSREIIEVSGKSILSFSMNYNPAENLIYHKLSSLQESLFELICRSVSCNMKEMHTEQIGSQITNYIHNLHENVTIEQDDEIHDTIEVNLEMLKTSIDALWLVFEEEFSANGFFLKIKNKDFLSFTVLCPHLVPEERDSVITKDSALELKIQLVRAALENSLALCNLKFQIAEIKGTLLSQITVVSTKNPEE